LASVDEDDVRAELFGDQQPGGGGASRRELLLQRAAEAASSSKPQDTEESDDDRAELFGRKPKSKPAARGNMERESGAEPPRTEGSSSVLPEDEEKELSIASFTDDDSDVDPEAYSPTRTSTPHAAGKPEAQGLEGQRADPLPDADSASDIAEEGTVSCNEDLPHDTQSSNPLFDAEDSDEGDEDSPPGDPHVNTSAAEGSREDEADEDNEKAEPDLPSLSAAALEAAASARPIAVPLQETPLSGSTERQSCNEPDAAAPPETAENAPSDEEQEVKLRAELPTTPAGGARCDQPASDGEQTGLVNDTAIAAAVEEAVAREKAAGGEALEQAVEEAVARERETADKEISEVVARSCETANQLNQDLQKANAMIQTLLTVQESTKQTLVDLQKERDAAQEEAARGKADLQGKVDEAVAEAAVKSMLATNELNDELAAAHDKLKSLTAELAKPKETVPGTSPRESDPSAVDAAVAEAVSAEREAAKAAQQRAVDEAVMEAVMKSCEVANTLNDELAEAKAALRVATQERDALRSAGGQASPAAEGDAGARERELQEALDRERASSVQALKATVEREREAAAERLQEALTAERQQAAARAESPQGAESGAGPAEAKLTAARDAALRRAPCFPIPPRVRPSALWEG
ncbi:hypothetical protein CYMTET_32648, partial [Cymbomonas tetramitiformis]